MTYKDTLGFPRLPGDEDRDIDDAQAFCKINGERVNQLNNEVTA